MFVPHCGVGWGIETLLNTPLPKKKSNPFRFRDLGGHNFGCRDWADEVTNGHSSLG